MIDYMDFRVRHAVAGTVTPFLFTKPIPVFPVVLVSRISPAIIACISREPEVATRSYFSVQYSPESSL